MRELTLGKEKKPLILIVDDTPTNIQVLAEALRTDYRVMVAGSGKAAFEVISKAGAPDIILLDVVMPEMDGYAVLARLRETPVLRDIPVIFLTALNDASDEEHGLELGAADYLTKPIKPRVVLARVRTQLEAKQARDGLKNQNTLLEAEVKRRTAELLEVQSQLRATLDAIPDLLFELGLDGRYHDYHSHRTDLLAAPAAVLLGKKVTDALPPAAADVVMSALHEADEKGRSSGKQFELQLPQGNLWFELSVSRKSGYAAHDPRFIVMSRDITERKTAERQLRDLTAHLQTVRDEEKTSIAREIHDVLGCTLSALKVETYCLKDKLPESEATEFSIGHIGEISHLIEEAANIIRNIITGLHPPILDDLGLHAALEWQAGQFQKRTGIQCRVNCIGDRGNLDKLHSITLFRICQESLTNVMRHSGASHVDIEYHHSEEEVVISIIDDGCGLSKNSSDKQGSFGMLGMRGRVEQLGGTISFDTTYGGGLSVTAIFTLPAE